MCQNQRGRRSSTKEQKDYLLGKEYEATKKKWGGQGSNQYTEVQSAEKRHIAKPKGRTREILSGQTNMSKKVSLKLQKALENLMFEQIGNLVKLNICSGNMKGAIVNE